jgi:hypothetical protein
MQIEVTAFILLTHDRLRRAADRKPIHEDARTNSTAPIHHNRPRAGEREALHRSKPPRTRTFPYIGIMEWSKQ